MVSAGLLILLLMSCSFNVSTMHRSPPTKDNQPGETSLLVKRVLPGEPTPKNVNKVKEGAKKMGMGFLHVFEKTIGAAIPVVALIAPAPIGMAVAGALGAVQVGVSLANEGLQETLSVSEIMTEFENMKFTLDKYNQEQKWDSWAPKFADVEMKIDVAWQMFLTMDKSVVEETVEEKKQNHRKEFAETYSHYVDATKILFSQTTASNKPVTLMGNFGKLLAEHTSCHENDIMEYNKFIGQLIYRGDIMNQFYYRFKAIESEARIKEQANIAYEIALVMFNVHRQCLTNSLEYVEKDVMGLIDAKKTRQELSNEIWSFLNKVYNKYDWLVVAYICKHSDHHIMESRKSHVVAKFSKVMLKDGVCVAVARQMKGTQTKAADIKDAIKNCVPVSTQCYEVEKKLSECPKEVEIQGKKIPVSETYTAVHSYTSEPHHTHGAQEAPDDDNEYSVGAPNNIPYIYTGDCKRSKASPKPHHKYVVLIKSEEEIVKKNPCVEWDCGEKASEGEQRGKCVQIEGLLLALCECKRPYYGLHCEENFEDYKRNLKKSLKSPESLGIKVTDSRRPIINP